MNIEELKRRQEEERKQCLEAILQSDSPKKIIIAGPGTGKTFTFGQVLKNYADGNNLALTFINKLANDMQKDLDGLAEVKTFHAYCKKILHQLNARVELVSYLSLIIKRDAELLGKSFNDFDTKFQMLDEENPEITFYLERGDYYDVVSFNDSVYRLYKILLENLDIIPNFQQIVVDEFQDFNPLEVAFINQLEKKGNILIVGDDDQSVYKGRCASSEYLREKYKSGEYAKFELPFCCRCPEVIVQAINVVLEAAQSLEGLKGRIAKRFECYIGDKERDSEKYPKIITAQCSTAQIIPKYIHKEILRIPEEDISESYIEGKEYPTILIVGPRQYLREVERQLNPTFPQITYSPSKDNEYSLNDGYEQLLRFSDSNLGWRILLEYFFQIDKEKEFIQESYTNIPLTKLIDSEFIKSHLQVVDLLKAIRKGESITTVIVEDLKNILGDFYTEVIEYFNPSEEEKSPDIDKSKPSILLSSYVGCKGLSAGHVFLVGVNNGDMPKITDGEIKDVELSKFIVALTRTRKQCHIISNKWLFNPMTKDGKYKSNFEKSIFTSWIPVELIEDRGYLKASNIKISE